LFLENVVLLDSSPEAWLPLRTVAKPTNAAVRRSVARPAPRRSGGRSGEYWRGGHRRSRRSGSDVAP